MAVSSLLCSRNFCLFLLSGSGCANAETMSAHPTRPFLYLPFPYTAVRQLCLGSFLTSSDFPHDHEAWIIKINFIDEEMTYLLKVTSLPMGFTHVIAEPLSFQLPWVCDPDQNFQFFKT